jgi:hypothetical protein
MMTCQTLIQRPSHDLRSRVSRVFSVVIRSPARRA